MEYFSLIIVLFIAMLSDIKTMEVPLYLWPIPIVIRMILHGFELDHFLLAIGIFVMFFIFNLLTNFGGADTLLITSIVYVFGIYGIFVVFLSFLLVLPYTLWMKIKNKEKAYPFVPFLFFSVLIYCVERMI